MSPRPLVLTPLAPLLAVRLLPAEHAHKAPRPIILDPSLRLPPSARLLTTLRDPVDAIRRTAKAPWIVCDDAAVSAPGSAGEARRRELERAGAMVLPVPMTEEGAAGRRLDWSTLPGLLAQLGVRSVMIEGGADVIRQCLAATRPQQQQQQQRQRPLVDRVIVTVAPHFVPGGLPVLGDATTQAATGGGMQHVHAETLGRDAVLVLRP